MAKKKKRPTTGPASPEQLAARLGRRSSGAAGAHGMRSRRTERRQDAQALRRGDWS